MIRAAMRVKDLVRTSGAEHPSAGRAGQRNGNPSAGDRVAVVDTKTAVAFQRADATSRKAPFDSKKLAEIESMFGVQSTGTLLRSMLDEAESRIGRVDSFLMAGALDAAKEVARGLKCLATNWAAKTLADEAGRFECGADTVVEAQSRLKEMAMAVSDARVALYRRAAPVVATTR